MYRLFLVFLLGLLSFSGCSKENKHLIKIAVPCPLTGDLAAMGQGMKKAVEIAVEEANATTVLKGMKYEVAAYDDRADPKEAVNIANQIVSDSRIFGVIGHLNSGCSIPASQIYSRYNLVIISPASTNPKLTYQGLKNVFRVCTTDDVQGSFAANYTIDKLKLTKAAVLHDKTAYGQGLGEEFKKQFEIRKGKVLSFDGINIGDKDFKALLTRIKTQKPQVIYFGGVYTECGLIAKQAKEIGIKAPVFSDDGVSSPEFIKIGGKATEGSYTSLNGVPPEKLASSKSFIEKFKSKYPNTDLQPYDPYTYEAAKILIESIEKTNMDKTKIASYISAIKYKGILGETSFDERGDTLNKSISIYKVINGKFEYVD